MLWPGVSLDVSNAWLLGGDQVLSLWRGATLLSPALARCSSRRSCSLDSEWRIRWSRRFYTSVSWLTRCVESDGRFSSILIKNLASKMLVKAEIFIYFNSIVSSQILKIYCLKIHILYKFLRLFTMNTGHRPCRLAEARWGYDAHIISLVYNTSR